MTDIYGDFVRDGTGLAKGRVNPGITTMQQPPSSQSARPLALPRPAPSASPDLTPALLADVHSSLSTCRPARMERPADPAGAALCVQAAARRGEPVALLGAQHAMGGQAFLQGGTVLDLTALRGVRRFDPERGRVEVLAGTRWPELIDALDDLQGGNPEWVLRQKQTGADQLTVGGAVAVNAHGRGLDLAPLVGDIHRLEVVDAAGRLQHLSRGEDPEGFGLVVGGYGLCGLVTAVELNLCPYRVLERRVALLEVEELMDAMAERYRSGATYGDFQFAIDPDSPGFLKSGLLSTYQPLPVGTERPGPPQLELSPRAWSELLLLAHVDKRRAFERYAAHYLATHGQRYGSDRFQLGVYVGGYHHAIDGCLGHPGSEKIGEVYVPRERLTDFFAAARPVLRGADVIYGTVRLIEPESVTCLQWAREPWACVVFNLHTPHTPAGQRRTQQSFAALYDLALARGGSFYLTYGRDARREQVLQAYPSWGRFCRAKQERDPEGRFSSDWWRAYGPR
jgi:FAD/FMN-containing dehydrogenase